MGRAAGAFGLKGELKVFSHAEDPEVFLRGGRIYAGPDPQTARPYTPYALRPHAGRLLLRLREITTREQAQELKGAWVWVEPRALAPLGPDEYYWYQLRGARVVTPGGRELGRIKAVLETGAHELWVVESPGRPELILPATDQVVREMDVAGGRLVVEPPEGLLSVQGWEDEGEKGQA